jgi:hypothetical protein
MKRISDDFWPRLMGVGESDSRASFAEVFVDVGVGAAAGHLGDLAVAEAGNAEGEVLALARWEFGEASQCAAGFEGVVNRDRVGDDGVPSLAGGEVFEVRVTVSGGEAVGLVDGDYLSYLRHTRRKRRPITSRGACPRGVSRKGPKNLSVPRGVPCRRR